MPKTFSPKLIALTFGVLVLCFLAVFYVVAWTEPTVAPPDENVPAPLNAGNIGQSKVGGLLLNTGGAVNGLIIDNGNLCFGSDCRNSWGSVGGGTMVVAGSVCPSDYSPFMSYYESKTFYFTPVTYYNPATGQTIYGDPVVDCISPAGWGLAMPYYYGDYFNSNEDVIEVAKAIQMKPSCKSIYLGSRSTIFFNYPDVILRTLCIIDNP